MTNKSIVPINPIDILIQLNWAEGDGLEFKSARGGLPKSLWGNIQRNGQQSRRSELVRGGG